MNNDDRLSSGLNIDMCIEQMESKMSDDIIMQQIYISLCAYKIEIEKLQNENEELKLELSGYRIAILKNDNLLGLQQKIDKAIEVINTQMKNLSKDEAGNLRIIKFNLIKGSCTPYDLTTEEDYKY